MAKQFENVSSRYGAPMGRASFGNPAQCDKRTIRVFKVRLDSGGYDDGGAYWGSGGVLWCATDGGDYRQFTRADNVLSAVVALGVPFDRIKSTNVMAAYNRLKANENRGIISASGVMLRQQCDALGAYK